MSTPSRNTPWFARVLVGMEIGPTGAQFGNSAPDDPLYCRAFDMADQVRAAHAAGAEYVVVWARDGDFAYYPSKLLPQPLALRGKDPLRAAVREGRRLGIPVIAYCVVQQGGHFLAAHPEWEMRGVDGKPLGRFCLRSGYLDAMKAILDEQLAAGVDGFHIDMIDQGFGPPYGCWCATCRDTFRAEHGIAAPAGPTWDDAWDRFLEFRYASSARFEKALRAHVRAVAPSVSVDFNYHGNPPFSFETGQRPVEHAVQGDFITGETGVWGFSALTVGLNAAFYRAAARPQRVQVAMQRGVRMYHDQTTRPVADMRWELSTLLAHGAFVTLVDKLAIDGRRDKAAYRAIAATFRSALARRSDFGQPPHADVGLWFGARNRDWIGKATPHKAFQPFLGAHRAFVGEHLAWGVLCDENIDAAQLSRLGVVWLPDVRILSDAHVEQLRRYVEKGGHVVATGRTGTADRFGFPSHATAWEALAGGTCEHLPDATDHWIDLMDAPKAWTVGIPPQPFLVEGPAVRWKPTTAKPFGKLLAAQRTKRQQEGREGVVWPQSPGEAIGPAALVHRVGAGSVVTLAAAPDSAFAGEHPVIECRSLIGNLVRALAPGRLVDIAAPRFAESVVTRGGNGVVRVHFLAGIAPPQTLPANHRPAVVPSLIEDKPVYQASLRPGFPVGWVEKGPGVRSLTVRGGSIDVWVDDVHAVVRIQPKASVVPGTKSRA